MKTQKEPVKSARVIQVIETVGVRGKGTAEDMLRPVYQYWSMDGELLAERDTGDEK